MEFSYEQYPKSILIYGVTESELEKLEALAAKATIRCIAVADHETTYTIAQLLSGCPLSPKMPHPIPGRFALMDGFAGQEQLGAALINQAAPGVIKAARTLHNGNWPFSDLCEAILAEHRSMQK